MQARKDGERVVTEVEESGIVSGNGRPGKAAVI